ncbi:hypothetical protein [Hydrogenophaga sp. MI9]|uniref:hypothetical protein n=1 Tax=Hydrogenophaga sp. MI9 TaxID=3453719 RepID=UPI003EE835A8
MKRLLLVFAGLMVGVAHAQSVNWPAAWAGCAADARAYDAQSASEGLGGKLTSRKVQINFEEGAGSPPTVAGLQDNIQEARKVLANPKDWTLLIQIGSRMGLCGSLAALNQLQGGSTRSAASSATARAAVRDRPDLAANHCVSLSELQLRNTCNQRVAMNWCADSDGANACSNRNLAGTQLAPGDSISVPSGRIYWFACALPARPFEVEYLSGRGLRAGCTD